jgi:hypothetical protein
MNKFRFFAKVRVRGRLAGAAFWRVLVRGACSLNKPVTLRRRRLGLRFAGGWGASWICIVSIGVGEVVIGVRRRWDKKRNDTDVEKGQI